jgi:putative hydrolase of the HAD superfamily
MAPSQAIIFDLDGTLYSSTELAREIHRVAVHSLAGQLGIGLLAAEQRLAGAKEEIARTSGWEATLSDAFTMLGGDIRELHRSFAQEVHPEPHLVRDQRVIAMLERLAGNYSLYLYTNNNRPLAVKIMVQLGIDGYFRKIFSIEDHWRPKPDRLALELLLEEIAMDPVNCIFVGDRYDVDLRLPAELGGRPFLVRSPEDLLRLEAYAAGSDAERWQKPRGGSVMIEEVKQVLDTIRPALQADGGDVELVEVSADGVVKVKLVGACGHCPMSTMTLKMGIERTLKEKVPGVKEVVAA